MLIKRLTWLPIVLLVAVMLGPPTLNAEKSGMMELTVAEMDIAGPTAQFYSVEMFTVNPLRIRPVGTDGMINEDYETAFLADNHNPADLDSLFAFTRGRPSTFSNVLQVNNVPALSPGSVKWRVNKTLYAELVNDVENVLRNTQNDKVEIREHPSDKGLHAIKLINAHLSSELHYLAGGIAWLDRNTTMELFYPATVAHVRGQPMSNTATLFSGSNMANAGPSVQLVNAMNYSWA